MRDTGPIRIAVVEKNKGPYWDMVNAGWQDAAQRLDLQVEIHAPEYESIDQQVAVVQEQIDTGIDALALVASSESSFNKVIGRARDKNIPVMTFDLDAPASGRLMYIGMPTPAELGARAGRLMLEYTGHRGPIAVQTGSHTAHGAVGKLRGFVETVTKAGVEIVGGDNDGERIDRAIENAHRTLTANPDVRGCYGVYGYHAPIQADVLRDMGRSAGEVVVIGNDMIPETAASIRRGSVACSIWIREYYFGYYTAAALAMMARIGQSHALSLLGMNLDRVEDNSRRLEPMVITPANLSDFDHWVAQTRVFERTGASSR